jgi:hypothetical protein
VAHIPPLAIGKKDQLACGWASCIGASEVSWMGKKQLGNSNIGHVAFQASSKKLSAGWKDSCGLAEIATGAGCGICIADGFGVGGSAFGAFLGGLHDKKNKLLLKTNKISNFMTKEASTPFS